MEKHRIDNPYSGEIVAERPLLQESEIEGLVTRAFRAHKSWARTSIAERTALCARFCQQFEKDGERIAREVTAQMGKPLAQAQGEVRTTVQRARAMMQLAAEALSDEPLPPVPGFTRFIRHEPVGVVLDISAWNYPLLIAVNVVVPAVLAGNAVILKHANRTALCGDAFARAFAAAGAPENLVTAIDASHEICARIIARPEIGYVSFTGSVRGGHEVHREAASRFIDVGLELGGKDPAYVAPDADLSHAVANIVDGAYYNAGQSCCGIERIYVHSSIYVDFVERALAEVRKYRIGNPLEESTTMGPLAQAGAPAMLAAQAEEARAKGGRVLCGGKPVHDAKGLGRFFDPCLVVDANHSMHGLMVEESFGPIVGVQRVADDDEAVRLMNDSPYGLTASIWTRDQERAFRVGSQIETGTFFMNRCDYLDPLLPWTGVKDSGKGMSLSKYGFVPLTRRKSFHLRTQT
ncbi:MAG: aldehyde dehydrogenase family protein [Deltaproteobacteria bacterium]|nr:MAG: aldehyde dehydrogenase family protein [Deltaproteobacteria bacterium]